MTNVGVRYARTEDGVDIAYASVGSGPPLLIARPILRLAVDDEFGPEGDAIWLPLVRQFTIVSWDARGFGLSSGEPQYTLESSVRDVEAVADALSLSQFALLGHLSMAHTALAFAAQHADRVGTLLLWNPSPPGSSPRVGANADISDIADTHFHEFLQLLALRQFRWERGRVARKWVEYVARQLTAESWRRLMSEVESLDSTPFLHQVTARTLITIDETPRGRQNINDEATQYRRALAAQLPNAELVTLKPDAKQTYIELAVQFIAGDDSAEVASGSTAVILFADIVDSTALSEQLGDRTFHERSRMLEERVRVQILEHSGLTVEGRTLGDGVLATFASASDAIAAATASARAGEDVGLALHLGLHAGDVIRERGNVFGQAVSIAARVSDMSAPNEVLVSQTVRDLARASTDVSFEDRGERELKGVSEPVRVFAVRSED